MPSRIQYRNGDWVAIPTRDGAYGVGLVARHDGRGGVIVYCFDTRFIAVPGLDDLVSLSKDQVVRVFRCGDLALINGGWQVIGPKSNWRRDDWPTPAFGRRDASGTCYRVVYSESDFRGPESETAISDAECNSLPRDALSGSGAVERVLTELLAG